jgi:hypothetical protein
MRKPRNAKQRALALAYQRTFFGDGDVPHLNAEIVLADLRKQACIDEQGIVFAKGSGMVDSHASLYRSALRDMYSRIVGMLGLEVATTFTTSEEPPHEHPTAES